MQQNKSFPSPNTPFQSTFPQTQPPTWGTTFPNTQPPQNTSFPPLTHNQPMGSLPPQSWSPTKPPQNVQQQLPFTQSPQKQGVIFQEPQKIPTEHAGILSYIHKKPFTQMVSGHEWTYSILPKKQQNFVLTHDRFLILKGLQSIGYARQFGNEKKLPFTKPEDAPPLKTTVPVTQLEKCEVVDQKLVINISGKNKQVWEFQCPSKGCAVEWNHKINNVIAILKEFKTSGLHTLEEFTKKKQYESIVKQKQSTQEINSFLNQQPLGGQLGKSLFDRSPTKNNPNQFNNPSSPLKGPSQFNLSPTKPTNSSFNQTGPFNSPNQQQNKPFNAMFSGPQSSKIQNFMTNQQYSNQNDLLLGRSMSKITSHEKEAIKFEISKMRRNWIEELLGGEEEVELVIDFKLYVQKIASVIIEQLYVHQNQKIFPSFEQSKEHASFFLDDVYIELYFYSHETIGHKHPRYKQSVLEFKNFNYLLHVTQNEGILKVPFMVLFEYKGFLGMAKSRIGDNSAPKNRQCLGQLNAREFEETSKISIETLLNEAKCKIVAYERKTSLSVTSSNRKIYFVEKLAELLPLEKDSDLNQTKILRGQFLQDSALHGFVFRDRKRPVRLERVGQLLDQKVNDLIKAIENEEQYFTNSSELSDLLHYSGLNIRHLGVIMSRARANWFKILLQGEIAARCLKNLFRCDIQHCVMIQTDRQTRKESQEEIEKSRVINFLNIVFGNTQSTYALWRQVNDISRQQFGIPVAENSFSNVNIPYLLQALQTHFKIVLGDHIHYKTFFNSVNTFDTHDFVRFEFDTSIYNLNFTNLFEQINECLAKKSPDSFYNLCHIITLETSTKVPYLTILKNHPINDQIREYMLHFTSPEVSSDLYAKMEVGALPTRYLYESKLAEINWYVKANKIDKISPPASFIFDHARKWLGEVHPLFTRLNRLLSSCYSSHHEHYQKALKYAQDSIEMQKKIFGGQTEILWKDYACIGKVHLNNKNLQEAMKFLGKARQIVKVQNLKDFEVFSELSLLLCKGFFQQKKYQASYNTARQLYGLIKNQKDQKSLAAILEVAGWLKQTLQTNNDTETFYQFLELDFGNHLKAYLQYQPLLNSAIRILTIPTLLNAVFKKSKNSAKIVALVEDIFKFTQSSQLTLVNYLKQKINIGHFPKSFFQHLKEIDSIAEEIGSNKMLQRWKQFYLKSPQPILDKMGSTQLERGFQFLPNMTALFNLFGKEVLDELHKYKK